MANPIVNVPQCLASDCTFDAILPSGFCSKRCYHRQYRRDHSKVTNAQQRHRYATDEQYRQTLITRNDAYRATEAGRINLSKRHARHLAKDPDYHRRYALEHSTEAAERARQWRLDHPEEFRRHMRVHAAKRRAQKLNQFIEDVNPKVVYAMHGGMCGICKEFIEGDFHVDHVIPLSRGGMHGYINVQPAHPSCNIRKGNKI